MRRLEIAPRRPVAGLYAGQRRSPRTARSPEFADFRPYAGGDDLRQVDWAAYARLERLLVRLHVAEDETALNLVLDASLSMSLGRPSKLECARTLAGALGMVAAAGMDRVAVGAFGRPGEHTRHGRGRQSLRSAQTFMGDLEASGAVTPEGLNLAWLRPGITIVISDFLVEGDWAPAFAGLRARRQEPVCWQLLTPEDREPPLAGDFELVEVEGRGSREMTVTPVMVGSYRQLLQEHVRRLRVAVEGAGGRFLSSTSSAGLAAWLQDGVRSGVLRRR